MDNDESGEEEAASDNEPAEIMDEDSDLPSDFEREMAVDNSDDEEEEDEEENPEKLKKDIDQHKQDMEALKERDPEFYEFLQKEDANLLDFQESDVEFGDDLDDEEDEKAEDLQESAFNDSLPVLDKKTLNEWIEKIKASNDFTTFKKLLNAFKTAARMSEEDDNVSLGIKIEDPAGNFIYLRELRFLSTNVILSLLKGYYKHTSSRTCCLCSSFEAQEGKRLTNDLWSLVILQILCQDIP